MTSPTSRPAASPTSRPAASPTSRPAASPTPPAAGWHSLEPAKVIDAFETSADGLDPAEAARRLAAHGANAIEPEPPPAWWRVLARQFVSPLIGILVVAAVIVLLQREWVDAAAIIVVLVLNAGIGFWQERRAASTVEALRSLSVPTCRVLRDGVISTIDAAELVPGDLVPVESGERVPADLRLVRATTLGVDESLLTGEVLPVQKTAAALPEGTASSERTNLAFSGTLATTGRGLGVVVATGAETQLGGISDLVAQTETPSPLQVLTHQLERRIGIIVAITSALVFAIGLAVGYGPGEMFRTAVALAVATVPESLPIVLTVAMSLGVARMARHNAIVRSLPAVETLGSTTVICSDKTGTLTRNELTVEVIWTPGGATQPRARAADEPFASAELAALRAGALTNEAVLVAEDSDRHQGDAVDVAIVHAALRSGAVCLDERAQPPLGHMPYEPELRISQTLRVEPDGRRMLSVKGAPDVVADLCARMATPDGARAMDVALVERQNGAMAADGMRVIATAERELAPDEPTPPGLPWPAGLTLLGLLGLEDPLRPGVVDAIAECHRAGIRVTMLTGDHPATASSIGRQLGLDLRHPPLTGAELESLDDAALERRLGETTIAARITPRDKLRIVRAHERRGEVTAVTGDGVNDAPALKAASIGVAMGRSGTDVAREAADIVLADDNFVSIVRAVRQGRVTFSAIRNATFFLLASGLASLLAVSANVVVEGPLLFLPVQLLFLNVVTTGLQDIALAFEPPAGDVLRRKPRPRSEGVLSRVLWWRLLFTGAWIAAAVLATFWWALREGYDVERARTLAITLAILMNFFVVIAARSEHRSVFAMHPLGNPVLLSTSLFAILLHFGATLWPPAAAVLGFAPLGVAEWVACVLLGTTALVVPELHKLWGWRRARRRAP